MGVRPAARQGTKGVFYWGGGAHHRPTEKQKIVRFCSLNGEIFLTAKVRAGRGQSLTGNPIKMKKVKVRAGRAFNSKLKG
jgi:hypothetical protein